MKVVIATVQSPFVKGGAEYHARGLHVACQRAGHEVDIVTMPFRFSPETEIWRAMSRWEEEDFEHFDGYSPDLVICLKFPTYYLKHPNKVLWLLHQHRPVYDLWNAGDTEAIALKDAIMQKDNYYIARCLEVFANSANVAQRLRHYNQLDAKPLYHPPPRAEQFYTAPAEPYIFYPSRLEPLKRQHLLVAAMQYVSSPVVAVLAGEGSQFSMLQELVAQLHLGERVRLLGRVSEQEMLDYYARCLGVFFGPYDEDYGYVTLEAMLAAKPVITCHDSGGPLEFVIPGDTGYLVNADPQHIAHAIDELYRHQEYAGWMGAAGRRRYDALNLSWDYVMQHLLA